MGAEMRLLPAAIALLMLGLTVSSTAALFLQGGSPARMAEGKVRCEGAGAVVILTVRTTRSTEWQVAVILRLIALGSDGLTKAGYARVKHEVVTGPMPAFGGVIKTSDDLWRIIALIWYVIRLWI
jgi:hypothetical protein